MLIAIANSDQKVSPHFGHCEQFTLYDTENRQLTHLESPGHEPGMLPLFLKEHGVDLVIAGGMGSRAQNLFAEKGIRVIVGASGAINDVIQHWENNTLTSSGEVCSQHNHQGGCQNHAK